VWLDPAKRSGWADSIFNSAVPFLVPSAAARAGDSTNR
jgi:hypothetical protein